MKPLYTHDCTRCVYLDKYKETDLYWCDQGGNMPTLINRYGNNGPEYESGPLLKSIIPSLMESVNWFTVAFKRAQDKGLIK